MWPEVKRNPNVYRWPLFFSYDQVALGTILSVFHTFLTMFVSLYQHEIFKSYYH